MVSLICGPNGTGKTRRMIEMANNEINKVQGKMVFIEVNNKHIYDLDYKIRYINTKEYGLINAEQFRGFVCGLLATDYDIEMVFIDGLYKITDACNKEKTKSIIDGLEELAAKFKVNFVLSLNFNIDEVPQDLKEKIYA
ncbi:ATP-binding protein [Sedimentibacter sp. zth1]|uniref:ATP-binding protein n=1 Tax=Sedimentibacter sp. zth1 TaxID=2816908 RepID=UPI001A91C6BE|nr:ATP-binding protein [Sedimentibacter sp. zth1]QSX07044.1 ATP-binding protein [Sedimentibacter sp. zth1]